MKTTISALVEQYIASHPDCEFPESGDRHPSILAIGSKTQAWLCEQLGGIWVFWDAMLDGAKVWFTPENFRNSREFRVFCYLFESVGNLGADSVPEYLQLCNKYHIWRRSLSPTYEGGISPSTQEGYAAPSENHGCPDD